MKPRKHWCRVCWRCRTVEFFGGIGAWWVYRVWRKLRLSLSLGRLGDITLQIEWKLADMWIGLFWRVERWHYHDDDSIRHVEAWLCVLPCVPLHIYWRPYEGDEVPF